MRRSLLALLLFAGLAGCDALTGGGESGPAWTRTGARLVYDYEAGPDSLYVLDSGSYRVFPTTPAAIQMRINGTEFTRRDDGRTVLWEALNPTGPRYDRTYSLPLQGEEIIATERGIEIVVPSGCSGSWLQPARGTSAWIRVPLVPRSVRSYAPCSLSPGGTYQHQGTATVETPAGTFATFILQDPRDYEGTVREYWSYEVGLVQVEIVNAAGVRRGRFLLAAREAPGT